MTREGPEDGVPIDREHWPIRVLLVVDHRADLRRIRGLIARSAASIELTRARDVEHALQLLSEGLHDVALLDLHASGGVEALERARVASDSVPIVTIAEDGDPTLALRSLRLGAQDCLAREGLSPELLVRALRNAVERHRMLRSLREARAREHHIASHDGLTGLPNRHAFLEGLDQAVGSAERYGRKLAVLFFDLNGFKGVNDGLGHEAGDMLLQEVARRLGEATRRSDLVARLGGDEFVVAVKDVTDARAVMRAAENFSAALDGPYTIHGHECWVGASVGVALYPGDAGDAEALIRAADLAMYHAKEQGEPRIRFYQPEMDRAVQERFAIVASVREATRRGELLLEFQPVVDLLEEGIVGAEALLRWRHPERGILAPGEFIEIAEDTGMMHEIGRWVLHRACEAALAWGEGEGDPFVAINVSNRQLEDPDYATEVCGVLAVTGLPPRRLVLELTEPRLIHPRPAMLANLEELDRLGVGLAIDDFGTGTGSLSLLQSLPVGTLKIHDSFVSSAAVEPRSRTIVGALVALAGSLGLTAAGEGIETLEQLRVLRELGCVRMQGYLLGKPVSAEELAEQLAGGSAPWRDVLAGEPVL